MTTERKAVFVIGCAMSAVAATCSPGQIKGRGGGSKRWKEEQEEQEQEREGANPIEIIVTIASHTEKEQGAERVN